MQTRPGWDLVLILGIILIVFAISIILTMLGQREQLAYFLAAAFLVTGVLCIADAVFRYKASKK